MSLAQAVHRKRRIVNRLNELSGKDWIRFTKSWFILSPPRRDRTKIVHPAGFPESLVKGFIEFFTKPGMWVLDPFLGSGSTLLAAKASGRNAVGVEINSRYVAIAKKRLAETPGANSSKQLTLKGDSSHLADLFQERSLPKMDFCITSPPYWNQLKRASMRQRERAEKGWDTRYSRSRNDLGNIDDSKELLQDQTEIFAQV